MVEEDAKPVLSKCHAIEIFVLVNINQLRSNIQSVAELIVSKQLPIAS